MRATVLYEPGAMEIRDVPEPVMGPHDVLVSVQAVGLCGSDFHIYSGEANYHTDERGRPIPLKQVPQVLGHEVTGRVEAVGDEVTDALVPGDRVAIDQGLSCVSARRELCEYCETGDSHQCANYEEYGITGLHGGLAERMAVPAVNTLKVQSDLEPAQVAMTEPVGCVLHALEMAGRVNARYKLNASDPARRVRNMLLVGAGPAGLIFIQLLRKVFGYDGQLLVSEPDAERRRLAEGFGAEAVDPTRHELVDVVLERTDGRLMDYVIEASGHGPIFEELPALFRKQATLQVYGFGHGGASLETLNSIQFREPAVVMSTGASGGFDADGKPLIYKRSLEMIETGVVEVASYLTHRYAGLDDVPAAFAGGHREPGYVKGIACLTEDAQR